MQTANKHLILLGFKHVGKSALARDLAKRLRRNMVDLDHYIEHLYHLKFKTRLRCSDIVKKHGEDFFRNLETTALNQVIHFKPSIIPLGGGTPLRKKNQALIKPHLLIHVTADPETVFSRIMFKGVPAYFPADEDPRVVFDRLWQERERIYSQLTDFKVDNSDSILLASKKVLEILTT